MRLFIAINFNEDMKDWLMDAIRELKKSAEKGRFTLRENLHLTLVFLGEIGNDRLVDIKTAMNRVNDEPFDLTVEGFGRFRRNGGDIYWAGVEKNEVLLSIQKRLTAELSDAGFVLEKRAYSPHLTLGREVRLSDELQKVMEAVPARGPEMEVNRISLMKSERAGGRMVYTEIYGRDLTGRE